MIKDTHKVQNSYRPIALYMYENQSAKNKKKSYPTLTNLEFLSTNKERVFERFASV